MDITAVLAEYVRESTVAELEELIDHVTAHLNVVRAAAAERDFIDVRLAEQIVAVLTVLLAEADDYTARERALLAGAARYFTDANDENRDLFSPTGFDDDVEVLNAVCKYVGRTDLTTHLS